MSCSDSVSRPTAGNNISDVNPTGAMYLLGQLDLHIAGGNLTREQWQEAVDAAVEFQARMEPPC